MSSRRGTTPHVAVADELDVLISHHFSAKGSVAALACTREPKSFTRSSAIGAALDQMAT